MKPGSTIDITLHPYEWKHIATSPITGGFGGYITELKERARPIGAGVELSFDKQQMGDLIFHMIYNWDDGSGGYQSRLRKAFGAALVRRLGLDL